MEYKILILPIIAGIFAQFVKLLIKSNHQKFSLKNIFAYSGMPSGHSAIVISLVAIIGLELGINSPIFALALVFAVVVIRDAVGLRQYLGQHGKMLNLLVKDLEDDKVLEQEYPHLLEKIGHTPAQVATGSLIGFAISLLGYFFI